MTDVLLRRRDSHVQRGEHRGRRVQAEMEVCGGKPRATEDCWQATRGLRRQGKIVPCKRQREQGPTDSWVLDFPSPES